MFHRSDVDALQEQWTNGNHSTVIAALCALDAPFAALAGAYLYHEMPDDYHRGVFARMLQRVQALPPLPADETPAPSPVKARESWRRRQGQGIAHLYTYSGRKLRERSACSLDRSEGTHPVAASVSRCERCTKSATVDERASRRAGGVS